MQILLNKKEKEVLTFLKKLCNENNKDLIMKFLVKKGLEGITNNINNIPKPYREILNTILKGK